MEGGPPTEYAESVIQQPDLLETFYDREVTIFGITGTFGDLADMCPVDLSSPDITVEAKNAFVVKAANEAGLEIEPEHEELFTQIVEQHGLERKFTIAEHTSDQAVEHNPRPVESKDNANTDIRKHQDEQQVKRQPETVNPRSVIEVEHLDQQHRIAFEVTTMVIGKPHEKDRQTQPIEQLPRTVSYTTENLEASDTRHYGRALLEHVIHEEAQIDMNIPTVRGTVTDGPAASIESPRLDFDTNEVDDVLTQVEVANTFASGTWFDAISATSPSEYADTVMSAYLEGVTDNTTNWSAELSKEPLDIYDDFTIAIGTFAESQMIPLIDDGRRGTTETKPMMSLAMTISERLIMLEIDEKELVAPILKDIAGVIHGIQVLETQGGSLEAITEAKDQLEELCINLLEAMGSDYDEQTIEQFLTILLHPEFQLAQPSEEELDLEHMGTREIKRHFALTLGDSEDPFIESQLPRTLGMFALIRTKLTFFYDSKRLTLAA